MPMSIYTVPSTKIVHETKVDFSARHDYCAPIYLVQYDHSIPIIAVTLRNQQASYKLDDSYEVWIRWRKPDNTFIRKKALGCNSSKNVVYFEVTQQMVMMYGSTKPVVELVIPASTGTDPQVASSASFNVVIERNPVQNGDIQSMDQYEDPYGNVAYTKSQIDTKFAKKADKSTTLAGYGIADAYTKNAADKKFAPTMIDGSNISNGSVSLPKLTTYVTNLLYIINKSNYTLLFDPDFRIVGMYDSTTIGAANLDSPTAKYLFIPSKVTKIQSGAGTKLPKLTNVYINSFKGDLNLNAGAFSSGVSISYVKDSTVFNTLDYFVKDLLGIHTEIAENLKPELGKKANIINSYNIFDFDAWAKELQKLNQPVYHGTLDELNFDEKSITITPTEKDTYTNSWMLPKAESMKIGVKPNTKYWVYWLTNNYNCNVLVYLNGINTEATRVSIKNGKGAFVTNNDTSFITLRFGNYQNSAFKVSKIMITEKESIYLPNKVAEGVPEVAEVVQEVASDFSAFKTKASQDINSKYNSSSIEYGTSTLEIYSTQTDKTKSATCMYKRVGNTVTAVIKLIMNAVTLPAPGTVLHYKQMPFKNMDVKTMCVGVSDNDHKVIKGQVTSSGWLQVVSTTGTALSFAQDEEIDFIVTYRVNKT